VWYEDGIVGRIPIILLRLEVEPSTPLAGCADGSRTWSEAGDGLHDSVRLGRSHNGGGLGQRSTVTLAMCAKYALRLIHFRATLCYHVCNMYKDSA
jgi:hypothetical protein